jgi:hypothetical protein
MKGRAPGASVADAGEARLIAFGLVFAFVFAFRLCVSRRRPCGNVGNAASSRFPHFHQGGSPFFLFGHFFFLCGKPRFPQAFPQFC